jgi:transposase
MKHVFHKEKSRLTDKERWHLDRYLSMSEELTLAYPLKESYCA